MDETKKDDVMQVEDAGDALVWLSIFNESSHRRIDTDPLQGQRCSPSRTRLLAQRQATRTQAATEDGLAHITSLCLDGTTSRTDTPSVL